MTKSVWSRLVAEQDEVKPTGPPPLQTHGLYDSVWNPPRSGRFVSYDSNDEAWMRPLGMGTITKTLCKLYDVRLPDGTLVGYTEYDPTNGNRSIQVNVTTNPVPVTPSYRDMQDLRWRAVTIDQSWLVVVGREFTCWRVNSSEDAADLILVKFIKVIGIDNLNRYVFELRCRDRRRNYGDWT